MLSDLQKRKIDRAFTQMDADGSGSLDRGDVQALAARLIVGFGETPSTAKGRAVLDTFDGIWHALVDAMDVNQDGRLSPGEFRDGMAGSFIDGPQYDAVFRPAAQAVVSLCDTDGDGVLCRDEFAMFQAAFGTSAEDVDIAFAALDADHNGHLDADELLVAMREFYTAEDPVLTGNLLYGQV
jgi:Ca2+-binding EF-hand superfamily protein